MVAVIAPAVRPVTTFSFKEALTWSFPVDLVGAAGETALDGLTGNGLRKASELGTFLLVALVNDIAIETAEVAAIDFSRFLSLSVWVCLPVSAMESESVLSLRERKRGVELGI